MRRTTVHSRELECDDRLRSHIDQQLLQALDGLGRIGQVHVRLYGRAGTGLHTCHIRVDVVPSGGVALGDTAEDLWKAVSRAAARIGPAVRRGLEKEEWPGSRRPPARTAMPLFIRHVQEGFVQQQPIRVTDFDFRHLEGLIEGSRPRDPRDARSVELLEQHLGVADVVPARRIGPDVVTMNSEVRVRDLDAHETITFRVVFPDTADADAGRISVLAPMGMAVLGRKTGEDVTGCTPGGVRRLRVERVLYQPEREGKDLA